MSKILSALSLLLFAGFGALAQTDTISEPVFFSVEQMPEFPGGDEALFKFMQKNVSYPAEARKKNIQGVVPITFIIDKNGYVTHIKVIRSIHPLLDSAAVAAIQKMPQWKPGYQKGKAVDVLFNIPVRFTLAGLKAGREKQ